MEVRYIFQYALGAVIVIGFFILLYFAIFNPFPEMNQRILDITVGALIGAFTMVVSYFYGSSKGSADKNDKLINGNAPK